MVLRGKKHAAVGQLASGAGAKLRKPRRSVSTERQLGNSDPLQRIARGIEAPGSRRCDERLRQADRARTQRRSGAGFEQIASSLVMKIVPIQMPDQDARIEDDHAGQSFRSRSSSRGS